MRHVFTAADHAVALTTRQPFCVIEHGRQWAIRDRRDGGTFLLHASRHHLEEVAADLNVSYWHARARLAAGAYPTWICAATAQIHTPTPESLDLAPESVLGRLVAALESDSTPRPAVVA